MLCCKVWVRQLKQEMFRYQAGLSAIARVQQGKVWLLGYCTLA